MSIQDFRGIKTLNLDLTLPGTGKTMDLAVLAGPNGCGKTTVLDACLICLNRTELIPDQRFLSRHNVRSQTQGFVLKAEVQQGAEVKSIEIIFKGNGAYVPSTDAPADHIAYFSSWRWPHLVGPVAITAGRRGKRPAKTEENRLWRIKNYFVNLKARTAFLNSGIVPSSANDESAWERLNRAWKQFYPSFDDRFEARVASEQVEEGFELFFCRNDDVTIPVESLSAGEIEVLTFIGSFIIEDFSDGIVFVDEPELHLHPAWHRAMLRAMRALLPNTQIICATHSTDILDSVASYERFFLLEEADPRICKAKISS